MTNFNVRKPIDVLNQDGLVSGGLLQLHSRNMKE
uniref:Uncharacterized protein n=1 Tax=Rhizophora mucronata TaxID=61149 RepID=A0A2P2P6U8_RHIMU